MQGSPVSAMAPRGRQDSFERPIIARSRPAFNPGRKDTRPMADPLDPRSRNGSRATTPVVGSRAGEPRPWRPRERLAARGIAALADAELLALVIGSGTAGAS